MIPLVRDTISFEEIKNLQKWLATNPRLTKGVITDEFEDKWSRWLGVKHSTFVNSGSSANFLMFDSLINLDMLRSQSIIVPAVSWVTTVSPVIQLGLNPLLCDCDQDDLGLNLNHFELLLKRHEVAAVIIVHVLGVPNKMEEIQYLCSKYNVILLEDCCEAPGSTYNGKKVGTFGLMSSFSFYYGHHISTIEGGMVCTNNIELNSVIKSIRSHGWARDLPEFQKRSLEERFGIKPFDSLYTFYFAGYNFRSTDLNAFLGRNQLDRLDGFVAKRNQNYFAYMEKLNSLWKQRNDRAFVSNFAYGLISEDRGNIINNLSAEGIECRPLICGSIGRQPFWIRKFGKSSLPNADRVHNFGFYIPNNPSLSDEEIDLISQTILKSVEKSD